MGRQERERTEGDPVCIFKFSLECPMMPAHLSGGQISVSATVTGH